jgi:hypothetical protein
MEQPDLVYSGPEISDPQILEWVPGNYRQLLEQINGCILFSGGLHIRGAVHSPEWHSLRKVWKGEGALHSLFRAVEESDVPFAQDCFGDQFLIRSGVIHKLAAECGEVESLAMDLDIFMERAQENPVEFLALQPLMQFLSEGNELGLGQLLNVYPLFMIKESANGVSLKAISMFEQISFLADFAKQIADVSEGTKVEVKVINVRNNEI